MPSQALDRTADLLVSVTQALERYDAHERLCTERWKQNTVTLGSIIGLLKWLLASSFGVLVSIAGYTVVFWVEHR